MIRFPLALLKGILSGIILYFFLDSGRQIKAKAFKSVFAFVLCLLYRKGAVFEPFGACCFWMCWFPFVVALDCLSLADAD